MRHSAIGVAALALTACSTLPASVPQVSGPAIVVVRDEGFLGAACTHDISINGQLVAKLGAGQSFSKPVADGKYRVSVYSSTLLCPGVRLDRLVDVAGKPAVLRIGVASNAQIMFDQIE